MKSGSCEVTSSDADNCFIIDGAITVNIDSSSDPAVIEELTREYLADAMDNDSLIDPNTLPEVVDVQYLGETYEDYLINEGGGNSVSCPGSMNVTNTKEVIVTYIYEVETAQAASSSVFLPKLERQILKELASSCQSEEYSLVGVKSAPDDLEANAGKTLCPKRSCRGIVQI